MLRCRLRQGSRLASWKTMPICGCGPVTGLAVEQHIAAEVSAMQAGDRPQQRGLAAAGRSDDTGEFAVANRHREIVDGVQRARLGVVELGRLPDRRACAGRPPPRSCVTALFARLKFRSPALTQFLLAVWQRFPHPLHRPHTACLEHALSLRLVSILQKFCDCNRPKPPVDPVNYAKFGGSSEFVVLVSYISLL